jgi:hypothetical protein
MPALPLDEAGKYIAGAYVVFFALVVLYVAIIGAKIARIEGQISELLDTLDERDAKSGAESVEAPDARLVEEATR